MFGSLGTPISPIRRPAEGLLVLGVILLGILSPLDESAATEDLPPPSEGMVRTVLEGLQDQTVLAIRLAERAGKKLILAAPQLHVAGVLELKEIGIAPGKYWLGVRLPKALAQPYGEAYPGLKPDEFIKCKGLVLPLGASLDMPLIGRSRLTVMLGVNVVVNNAMVFPGISFTVRF
jgi:hypothetical protein